MIREINDNDIETISNLVYDFDQHFSKHYDLNYYLDNKIYKIFVYEKEYIRGVIIATVLDNDLEILFIYVKNEDRNQGIATSLINYLIKEFNVKNIFLEVSLKNENAICLYKKLGFKIINIRKNYYKDSDAYLMRKEI